MNRLLKADGIPALAGCELCLEFEQPGSGSRQRYTYYPTIAVLKIFPARSESLTSIKAGR